jgi:hypothetical protein
MIEKYLNEVLEYCKLNNIESVDNFIESCFKQGFDIKKYGFLPQNNITVPDQINSSDKDCSEKDKKILMLQETLNKLRKELIELNKLKN